MIASSAANRTRRLGLVERIGERRGFGASA